jgi:hypothetical protein
MIQYLWAGLLLAACAAAGFSLQTPHMSNEVPAVSENAPRLSLTIRADRQEYRMSDSFPVEAQLTNTGSRTLYLFDDVCWNPGNFLTMHVFATDGKEVSGKLEFLRDCLPPPPRRNDISSFFRLEPNAFYGRIERFSVQELVPRPGDYDVVAYYEAALSGDWITKYGGEKLANLAIWTRDQPLLRSNRLHVTIKP